MQVKEIDIDTGKINGYGICKKKDKIRFLGGPNTPTNSIFAKEKEVLLLQKNIINYKAQLCLKFHGLKVRCIFCLFFYSNFVQRYLICSSVGRWSQGSKIRKQTYETGI